MGSPEFAIPALQKLFNSPHEIQAVVTGPDKRRGRGKTKSPTPVKATAIKLGLPVIEVDDLKHPDFADRIKGLQPDLLVVVAFRILPASILTLPKLGSVNLHASLLPKYRGAAPIHRAVMAGETISGCTVFFLNEKVDTGNIIGQHEIPIGPDETTGMVYERMMKEGADMLLESIDKIASGSYSLKIQDDEETTAAPKIYVEDCFIDFNQPAPVVHNFIRGLSPFPTSRIYLDGKLFKIYTSKLAAESSLQPFEIRIEKDRVLIGCNPGAVCLGTVQLEGKPKSSAPDFFRGYAGNLSLAK